ncbi:MAG: ParA family protein [Novosphingobium aromaticivorans]|nr:ParA family protein [Novosphingobium aromaticivorans]
MSEQILKQVFQNFEAIHESGEVPARTLKFNKYALSNFRGGIGKSTLSFNIGYELTRSHKALLLDTCSQRNFSQNIFGDAIHEFDTTIYDALVRDLTGGDPISAVDMTLPVKPYCSGYSGGQASYMIPGSSELFLFPSLLYSQLASYSNIGTHGPDATKRVLTSISRIIDNASNVAKPDKVVMDTSPFFGGATHLSWVAADALIIPARVDQHSVDALRLTFEMLSDQTKDYHRFNQMAKLDHTPRIHAVVMTHCGYSRKSKYTPDNTTAFFTQRAIDIAKEYEHLFSDKIENCFYLFDDFFSSGRISGTQRIPIARLSAGQKYLVDGRRLEVNPSVGRYQKELAWLTSAL